MLRRSHVSQSSDVKAGALACGLLRYSHGRAIGSRRNVAPVVLRSYDGPLDPLPVGKVYIAHVS